MTADGGAPHQPDGRDGAEQRAVETAVWLWEPRRARLIWANETARALWGLGARNAPTGAVAATIAALGARAGRARAPESVVVDAPAGPRTGAVAAARAALPDGAIGLRVSLALDAERLSPIEAKAAAFDAAPHPMAVIDRKGRTLVENAAFAACGRSFEGLEPIRLGGGLALLAPERAPPDEEARPGGVAPEALSRIAHEFRSPLTAVLGFAEFLRDRVEELPPERVRAYLDDLAAAGERMRSLADDLVALGAAPEARAPDDTDLDSLLDEALRFAAPAARTRKTILAPPRPSGLRALIDAPAVSRAVANLLDNAIRHGAPGGTVRLAARDLGRREGAALIVADDGPGLDEAELAKALEPYGRARPKRGEPAGGLGLPIARDIAEAQGGRLEIDTLRGAGFEARIVLPPGRVFRARRR